MADLLTTLTEAGVSIGLDDLSRARLTSGSLAALVEQQHVSGVTTNPSIVAKAIGSAHSYDAQIRELAGVHHCLQAADQLTAEGIGARVLDLYSVKPVDTAALTAAARRLLGTA
jgi:deoxyxylulose-5-phosphate synthase